ncbi:MAG: thioredoxin [Planctomycetes bacterium]|nr:thioredoxin [Planctomycetota bacterium]
MAHENVLEFTDDNFKQEVLSSDKPVLVDFWADWCQPCHMIAPTIDELAEDYAGRVKVGKVDTDANHEVSLELEISSIPTVMLFKDGEMVRKFVGVTAKQQFTSELDALLA